MNSRNSQLICPYCQQSAELVTGKEIYPHRADLARKYFHRCAPCGAYVGCHDAGSGQGDGTRPLGRLANAELRHAKRDAHAAFDPIWKSRSLSRKAAYAWLSGELGLPVEQCHIGEFDVAQCVAVVEACEERALS